MGMLKRFFLARILGLAGRLMRAAAEVDPVVRDETESLPRGTTVRIQAGAKGPAAVWRRAREGLIITPVNDVGEANVTVTFPSVDDALKVFTLQESPFKSYEDGRMRIEGDAGLAFALLRCLFRLEDVLVPGWLARTLGLFESSVWRDERRAAARRIIGRFLTNLVGMAPHGAK